MVFGGAIIADLLAEGGVRRFYTVPGESFLEILDGVEMHPDLTLVSTRHEGGASFMAEADAKVAGRPAVVAGTRAVGGANLAIGVHTAQQDSTPMVVLIGQVETHYLGREAFQEVDVPALFGPISKYAVTVHRADRIAEVVAKALRIATTGRPGPVVVAVPADLLEQDVPYDLGAVARRRLATELAGPAPDAAAIAAIAAKLALARRPVIVAGGGARDAREELHRVAVQYGAGVYAAFRRQDSFDNKHPHFLGHLGLGLDQRCLQALREADLVLVVGCRLNEITTLQYTLPPPSAEVCQIDIEPASIGAVATISVGLVSDARAALRALLARPEAESTPERDWSADHARYLQAATVPPSRAKTGCDPAQMIDALTKLLPTDAVVVNDAGNFSAFFHRHYQFSAGRCQIGPCNGAMGYGVPGAIGAKFAAPDRTVVGLAGDGGFLMTGMELETAVRYGLDLTIVVFRNGLHGTIAMHQARSLGRRAGTDIGSVDIAGVARGLGAHALTVTEDGCLAEALAEALGYTGPCVLDVVTDPDIISPDDYLSGLLGAYEGVKR